MAKPLPLIIADNQVSALAALALIASGQAWALIYIEDDIEPGRMRVLTAIAPGQEHRVGEFDDLIRMASERGGFAMVDPAVLMKRGAA